MVGQITVCVCACMYLCMCCGERDLQLVLSYCSDGVFMFLLDFCLSGLDN